MSFFFIPMRWVTLVHMTMFFFFFKFWSFIHTTTAFWVPESVFLEKNKQKTLSQFSRKVPGHLTVMELLSCLTLSSSCSRSNFSSELHFISFCFSSSLAATKRDRGKLGDTAECFGGLWGRGGGPGGSDSPSL